VVFNSLTFLVFAGVFFPVYFLLRGRQRLWWSLGMSYLFYGWWDWRFLSLIVFSTVMDWWFGLWIGAMDTPETLPEQRGSWYGWCVARTRALLHLGWQRRTVLVFSMVMNLGFLGFFKYFNFFIDSFVSLAAQLGFQAHPGTLRIILPVGISFYTFQSMSYTIDVYRRHIPVERSLLRFAAFIALFPQLVAGPIVRAADLLPQMGHDKRFEWARLHSGAGRILWGLFKKVALADSLAPFVDQCFAAPGGFGGAHLFLGVVFYSFQIYGDFSGYSDIAIGLARIMGYDFPENFRAPYFSRNFSEFWSRWHISLSTWLRDYLYIPLGGNRQGPWATYRNNLLTMLLGGLWHGANWAFVFWGGLHGVYLIGQRVVGPGWQAVVRRLRLPAVFDQGASMLTVYLLTLLAWVFFRSGSVGLAGGDSFGTAGQVLSGIFSGEGWHFSAILNKFQAAKGVFLILLMLAVEGASFRVHWGALLLRQPYLRALVWAILGALLAFFGTFGGNAFIYFQF
jgi:alginate O-acetyltransferase complex protein AlgI